VVIIKEIIHLKYSDPSLCLQMIADMLKIHPRKLSVIFKEMGNVPVNQYIHDVRMARAIQLLQNSKYNVSKIVEMAGFSNETYFYSLFRKRYGMTPKEYVLEKRMTSVAVDLQCGAGQEGS